jgi:hypothetical protein
LRLIADDGMESVYDRHYEHFSLFE